MRGLISIILAAANATILLLAWIATPKAILLPPAPEPPSQMEPYQLVHAYVTGYNTIVRQTDDTPCIAATGGNICGRRNVVACPRSLPLGTVVEIRGKAYLCEDRTAPKFDGRFDISCDKDKSCPFRVAGWTTVKVLVD